MIVDFSCCRSSGLQSANRSLLAPTESLQTMRSLCG